MTTQTLKDLIEEGDPVTNGSILNGELPILRWLRRVKLAELQEQLRQQTAMQAKQDVAEEYCADGWL